MTLMTMMMTRATGVFVLLLLQKTTVVVQAFSTTSTLSKTSTNNDLLMLRPFLPSSSSTFHHSHQAFAAAEISTTLQRQNQQQRQPWSTKPTTTTMMAASDSSSNSNHDGSSSSSSSSGKRSSSSSSSSSSSDDIQNSNNDKKISSSSSSSSKSKSKRFATGDELKDLRSDLESLRHNLDWAKALQDDVRIESLEKAIQNSQNRDPSFMYKKALKLIKHARKLKDASQEEKDALVEKWTDVAASARELLPEFNLEGLWIGSYGGTHGSQLINVTYVGDQLIAVKVTGDKNVPRGEQTFMVDMEPNNATALPPIQLVSDNPNRMKGEFHRFPGKGQVSRKGFKDHRFVEGQMILFENQFSFVWIPTKHHVLFSRPSPEQTLKYMRDTISKEDEVENMRNHITRCFDMDLSTAIARQQDPSTHEEPLRRISTLEELKQAEQRFNEAARGNIFFQMSKWRDYIDQVLDNSNSNRNKQ